MITNEIWSGYVEKYGLMIFHSKLLEFHIDSDQCCTKIEIDIFGQYPDIQEDVKGFWIELLESLVEIVD